MDQQMVLLWHWKSFDLYGPLINIKAEYGEHVTVHGIVTQESSVSREDEQASFLGIPRISKHRLHYYNESLTLLKKQYQAEGFHLEITTQNTSDALLEIGQANGLTELVYTQQLGTEEDIFIQELKNRYGNSLKLIPLKPNTLIGEDELPFTVKEIPDTFSKFRRAIEKRSWDE